MKALILAAGFATRLYPLTENTAKPLLEVKGIPVIDYIVKKIKEIPEINQIIVVSNNKFYKDFLKWKEGKKNIIILNDKARSNNERLGAIGDIIFAINDQKIKDDLLVISGDNYFTCPLTIPYNIFKEKQKDVSIFYDIKNIEKAKQFGVALIKDNMLIDFEEKPKVPKSTICSAATYFYRKETLELLNQFVEESDNHDQPGIFLKWLHKKIPIYAHIVDKWIDIGSIEALEEANNS